ncbi:hypothetical protein NUSPORA_02360 [Nucleospora cyclopteri]
MNGKNLFKAINEHAISLVNYYIGVLKIEPDDFARLDEEIRLILTKNKIHFQPSCKKRLYLPRTEMGRGLCSAEQRSEKMLLQLKTQSEKDRHRSIQRATILSVKKNESSHLAFIIPYLSNKYNIGHLEILKSHISMTKKRKYLCNKIKEKFLHSKLYKCAENSLVDCEASSLWLKKGNIKARDEAALYFLQDRNLFYGNKSNCPHCKSVMKTIDHLATRCDRMLAFDYTRRHNEIVRCTH